MPLKSKYKIFIELLKKIKVKLKTKLSLIEQDNTKDRSYLIVDKLSKTQIMLKWNIGTYFKAKLLNPRIYCLGIRIYDITVANTRNKSTCIMKEININKNNSAYLYDFPLDKGIFLVEIGYRNPNGKWSIICSSTIDLGLREVQEDFFDDSWFYLAKSKTSMPKSLHERLYRLSKSMKIGGSELIRK
tara:strand:+ start:331 stop:891 length:561 start_codon:yes stop_codon:yes gene_type:complete